MTLLWFGVLKEAGSKIWELLGSFVRRCRSNHIGCYTLAFVSYSGSELTPYWYSFELSEIILYRHSIDSHSYADDTQFYIAVSPDDLQPANVF